MRSAKGPRTQRPKQTWAADTWSLDPQPECWGSLVSTRGALLLQNYIQGYAEVLSVLLGKSCQLHRNPSSRPTAPHKGLCLSQSIPPELLQGKTDFACSSTMIGRPYLSHHGSAKLILELHTNYKQFGIHASGKTLFQIFNLFLPLQLFSYFNF